MSADPNRWKVLAIVCAAFFMTVLDVSIVNTATPIRNRRRRPKRSAERPPSSRNPPNVIAYAVITHCRLL